MKKNRYSKPKGKEVPSRRKLAMEAEQLQVVVEQQKHELRWERENLNVALEDRRTWRGRAETMREENERLRKQVEDLMPSERFLHVSRVAGFGKVDEMQRYQTVHLRMVHLGVQVEVEHFQMRGVRNPEAYREALADHIARQARKVVLEGLEIR